MGKSMGAHQSPAMQSEIWLTPPTVLNALGLFDLDPCACDEPRPWPTANTHYTKQDDGLTRDWFGRVWMNPPYGGPSKIGPWMCKMRQHNHGTALIFARTETAMFHECVWNAASAIFFFDGRLHFHYPDGTAAKGNAGAPSCLVAYGDEDADILRTCGLKGKFIKL